MSIAMRMVPPGLPLRALPDLKRRPRHAVACTALAGRAPCEPARASPGETARMIRIGCSGWNHATWRGTFSPQRVGRSRWLEHYASVLDTVERRERLDES